MDWISINDQRPKDQQLILGWDGDYIFAVGKASPCDSGETNQWSITQYSRPHDIILCPIDKWIPIEHPDPKYIKWENVQSK